jgi:hypothetical protein
MHIMGDQNIGRNYILLKMKMQKKAQITIFIVIGLIILVTVGFLLSSRSLDSEQKTDVKEDLTSDINSVNSFVDSCIKNTIEKGLENIKICNLTELEDYMDDNLRVCTLNNFNVFEGINITEKKLPKSGINLTIKKDRLTVNVDYPLTLKKQKSKSEIEQFYLEYKFHIKRNINIIGDEENVSLNGYQNSDIDTDSLNQPHIITSRPVSIYHKVNNAWQGGDMGVQWYGVQGGFAQIAIDKSDNAWISGNYIECAGCRAGNWVAYISNVAASNPLGFQWILMNWCKGPWDTGFVGYPDVDPYTPDKMYLWGGNQNFLEIDKSQSRNWNSLPYAGRGGEKFTFKIAPVNNAPGIFHSAIGSCTGSQCAGYGNKAQYINSKMSNSVSWFDGLFYPQPQVDAERTYIGLGTDLKNPEVAYLSAPFNGVSINIWDGTQMKYPINGLYVIDNSAIGVSANGAGSQGRIPQGWAPALGGGAFLCWTSSNGIRLKYLSAEGECFFGDVIDIGSGAQCAIATDSNGDIHMVYNNGGTKYRKIITSY